MPRNTAVLKEGDILEASRATFIRVANYGEIISVEETSEGIVFMFLPRLTWDNHEVGVGIWRPEQTHKLKQCQASAMHLRYFSHPKAARPTYERYIKGNLPAEPVAHERKD